MKYWIITTEYPPAHGGGISTYCYHTAKMLTDKGFNVKVFVCDQGISKPQQIEQIEQIEVVRFKAEGKEFYNYLGYHAALSYHFFDILHETIVKEGAPDYIESQEYLGLPYYLLLKKKTGWESLQSIPIIVTAHAPAYYYWENNQSPLYKLPDYWIGEMEKWSLKAADVLLSPSQYLMNGLSDIVDERSEKYHVVRNPFIIKSGPDVSNFKQGDIVFFGKLVYQKGCLQLLDFMTQLWDEKFPYPLSIIGGDDYFSLKNMGMKEHIEKKYKKYHQQGLIKFEGKLVLSEIEQRLAKAHIVIVPSIVDNFPYTVVEGMSMKKAMLVSDGGGQSEMIEDGISGYVYKNYNYQSFKEKMLTMISLNREQIIHLGSEAFKRINKICNYDEVYAHKMLIIKGYNASAPSVFPFIKEIKKNSSNEKIAFKQGMLSIVVPYYNTGKYVLETVENIFEVDYPTKEVIIIDDGSDEAESIEVLKNIKEKFEVKVIHQKNTGLAGARNRGLKEAKGEFIVFLDADDLIDKSFYRRGIGLLNQYANISFVSSWVKYFDASSGIWPAQIPEPPFLLIRNMINAGFVCRRQDYFSFGQNDLSFEYGMEDYDCNISLLKNGCRGIVIPEVLYHYRIHASSMARQFNKNNQLYLYKLLSKKHEDFYKEYTYEIYNLLQANGPSFSYDNPTFPTTDVLTLRNRIQELEKANVWYDNTLKSNQKKMEEISNVDGNNILQQPNSFVIQSDYEKSQEIQDWYNKEYEVLPLWYKRFGHIIKIITGTKK